jgi:hypothetical protein
MKIGLVDMIVIDVRGKVKILFVQWIVKFVRS